MLESASEHSDMVASSNAIVRIGTNGFPFLIRELSAEDNKLRKWMGSRKMYPWSWSAEWRRCFACKAVEMLGPEAKQLRPYVTNIFTSSDLTLRLAAFEAAAVLRLTNVTDRLTNAVVSDKSFWVRVQSAKHLVAIGVSPSDVLDLLVTSQKGQSLSVTGLGLLAEGIKGMPICSEVLETKMVEYAKSPCPQVRTFAAVGLPICQPESAVTRNILVELMDDTNTNVWMAASNSLAVKSPTPAQNKRRVALSK